MVGYLRHHTGKRAGQPITADAAGAAVDEVEAARWVTVRRRAGVQGRHRFVAHDVAPEAAGTAVVDVAPAAVQELPNRAPESAVDSASQASGNSRVGEGSGSAAGEGSLAYKESLRTDSPDDERVPISSAVGEVPVVAVENRPGASALIDIDGGLALRADGSNQPVPTRPKSEKRSSSGGAALPSYTGRNWR